ncbi:MAG: FtsX-like permease family protein, partial [Chloroflexota bacterium]
LMNALFGLSMTTIMYVLLAFFAVSIASVAWIVLRNRTMFKMGLRNVPRRGLQTGLIVVGLMLATLIITASFATGDTIDYSVSSAAYSQWQRTDLNIDIRGEDSEDAIGPDVYVSDNVAAQLQKQFANDPDIQVFLPFLYAKAAATSDTTKLSEPNANLTGIDPTALTAAGGLKSADGSTIDLTALGPDDALISERAAKALGSKAGDTLSLFFEGKPFTAHVVGVVKDEQASGVIGNFDDSMRPGGIVMTLSAVQNITGHVGQVNYISVALNGDVHSTVGSTADAAAKRVEMFLGTTQGQVMTNLGSGVAVETVKNDDVADAEAIGNLFTTFFLAIGLFSISAGIMLIFMIFVMLATERKAEMGMARAVGAQRNDLVQSFVSEGMIYNLTAGIVGVGLGVAAALGLVVGFLRYSLGDNFSFIEQHVTTRSLVVSFCLGVVLTFLTVVFASMKVSSVNIVAAIRGTPEDETPEARKRISWRAIAVGIPMLIVPPLGLYAILRRGFHISWAWLLCPAGILLGLFSIQGAKSGGTEALFSIGFTLIPLSIAGMAAHYKAPARLIWTTLGVVLASYWLSPWNIGEEVLGRELKGDIEMFLLSGIMVVTSFTLIIVFNARLLNSLFQRNGGFAYKTPAITGTLAVAFAITGFLLGDRANSLGQLFYLVAGMMAIATGFAFVSVRFPTVAPVLKMGVAYPLSNRFRTGMTIAMFSLIIFSLTAFSAIIANFSALYGGADANGGYDVVATANSGNGITSLTQDLGDATVAANITDTAQVTTPMHGLEVKATGQTEFTNYQVIGANDAFFSDNTKLESFANGYTNAAAALAAVAANPDFAILDRNTVDDQNTDTWVAGQTVENKRFDPFQVTIRNSANGRGHVVTVVGIWASRLDFDTVNGVYVNTAAYTAMFGAPEFTRTFVKLASGTDSKIAAQNIESTLASRGVQADSIQGLIDDQTTQDRAFNRMFQGLMALGLLVGVAALGVIAFRSVVERRQQIGMLRAIGYQRGSIALTFVMESGFIGLMGILSGVVGGVIVSRNIFTTGLFSDQGVDFTMPWSEVLVMVTLALAVSLVMTWLPSRNAANVPVAEALRYE